MLTYAKLVAMLEPPYRRDFERWLATVEGIEATELGEREPLRFAFRAGWHASRGNRKLDPVERFYRWASVANGAATHQASPCVVIDDLGPGLALSTFEAGAKAGAAVWPRVAPW